MIFQLDRNKWVRRVQRGLSGLVALVNYQPVFHVRPRIRTGGVKPRIQGDSRPIRRQRAKTRLHGEKLASSRAFFSFLRRICDERGTRPNWSSKNKTNFERLEEENHCESKLRLLIFRVLCKKTNYDF